MARSGRRVVITGMGAITPLGHSVAEFFAGLLAGRSGVGLVTRFDCHAFPTRIAAEVKDFDLSRFLPDTKRWQFSGLNTQFTLAAGVQAMADAGLADLTIGDRTRMGVYLGSGEGTQDFDNLIPIVAQAGLPDGRSIDTGVFMREGFARFHRDLEEEQELHTTTAHLASVFDLEGPNLSCLTACAASSQSIGEAAELIRGGAADIMLAGGAHSMVHPFGMTGFCLLTAMTTSNAEPTRASRPFDRDRDGFVLGEGGGILVLEELEHARRRGAKIYAELSGYGLSSDAYRLTDPPPDGRGAVVSMRMAIQDAALNLEDIGYVNAHGTSTPAGDVAESRAIHTVFGTGADKLPVSSTKSMTGHLVAAGGVVELIACIMALRQGVLPPTINYENPDPDCDLDYIPNQAREVRIDHALNNNFGFGGQNTTLIVSRFLA
jgi:3-oxoacyl-[acyl-carrier-protein] synthase II